jgi:hypothetical protein
MLKILVNPGREEHDTPVFIPEFLSRVLKPHQVRIAFLWHASDSTLGWWDKVYVEKFDYVQGKRVYSCTRNGIRYCLTTYPFCLTY